MQTSEKAKHINSFPLLWEELVQRFMAPVGQVSFWVFLILGILIFSACGVWIELGKYFLSACKSLDGVQTAIFTFIPAIACTATMQIIYSNNNKKYLMSFGYAVGIVLLLGAIGLLILSEHLPPAFSMSMGVLLSIISILTWWVANGLDLTLYDNVAQDVTTGGDPGKPLAGSVVGFKIK